MLRFHNFYQPGEMITEVRLYAIEVIVMQIPITFVLLRGIYIREIPSFRHLELCFYCKNYNYNFYYAVFQFISSHFVSHFFL